MHAKNFQKEVPQAESSGKLKIPLANGNIMSIPLSAINISEEVNRTGIWRQVNEFNLLQNKGKKKSPKNTSRFRKKKHLKKEQEKREERNKLEKRLSTMAEEEEDEGITIKFDSFKDKNYWKGSEKRKHGDAEETHV